MPDNSNVPLAEPLAYFLTWTTYGTWLPGDNRGWVKRRGIFEEPSSGLARHARQMQTEKSLVLSVAQRRIVEDTIVNHCQLRGWHLWICRSLSNHVHVVVTASGYDPDVVMQQFKAWCTRKLKEHSDIVPMRENWWTERGSTRFINDDAGLEGAILYVRDAQ